MPLLIVVIALGVWVLLIEVGILPSPLARMHLVIRNGQIDIVKGALNSRARQLVADIVGEQRIESTAFSWIAMAVGEDRHATNDGAATCRHRH